MCKKGGAMMMCVQTDASIRCEAFSFWHIVVPKPQRLRFANFVELKTKKKNKKRADRARHFSLFFVSHAIFSRFLGRGVHAISFFRELNTKTLRE